MFTTLEDIDGIIAKSFKPGEKVELILGTPRDLTAAEIATFESSLTKQGITLLSPVEIGDTPDWPNALRVEIAAPDYKGVGMLPLAVLLLLAAGVVGITTFLGIKVGTVVDQVSKYFVPTLLITFGFILGLALLKNPRRT